MKIWTRLVTLVALSGCLWHPDPREARDIGAARRPSVYPGRSVFQADLVSGTDTRATSRPSGSIEVVFRDDGRFEYRLILRDAPRNTYGAAWIVRKGESEPVAVLAADLDARGVYVQLRGAGSLTEVARGETLLEALRGAPGNFEVWLRASTSGAPGLRGVIR